MLLWLRRAWRRWNHHTRREIRDLERNIRLTEAEICRQIHKYAEYPCCPSCASFALESKGNSIDYLSAKNRRRRERLLQLKTRLRGST